MQLNWLIYVNIQSRAVLLNHGLKQQICRGSFGRLHIEKEEALLDTKTRQALFAGPIVFEIMMHLTENDKVYFWLCHSIVRRWGELEVSVCRLVMMGNISKKKTTQLSYTIIHVLRYPCLGFKLHLLHLHFLHFEGTIILLICYRIHFQCLSMNFSVMHTALLQLSAYQWKPLRMTNTDNAQVSKTTVTPMTTLVSKDRSVYTDFNVRMSILSNKIHNSIQFNK